MVLTCLKACRLAKGYSLRELAKLSGLDHTSIDRLERGRTAQDRTVYKLANALGVEPAALYTVEQAETQSNTENLQTPTIIKPARPIRARAKKQTAPAPVQVISFWVVDEDDTFGPFDRPDAERLKAKLDRARVYEAASRSEASQQHIQFKIRVLRGHDAW